MAKQTLQQIETKLKRWQTRLKRATNMVTKLDRQRRRFQILINTEQLGIKKVEPKPEPKPEAPVIRADDPDLVEKVAAALDKPKDNLDIPTIFVRPRPQGTEEERKAMPLSDKAARDYIRKKSIAIEKKREKRDRPFFKQI